MLKRWSIVTELNGYVVNASFVIKKEIFDVVAFIAKADNKIIEVLTGEILHDVPEDGATANLHHWFGSIFGLFT